MKNKEVTARAIELLKENGVDFHTERDNELGMEIVTVTHGEAEIQIYVGNDEGIRLHLGLGYEIVCMYLGDNDLVQGIKTEDGLYWLVDDDSSSDYGVSNLRETDREYMLNLVCGFNSDADIFTKIIK